MTEKYVSASNVKLHINNIVNNLNIFYTNLRSISKNYDILIFYLQQININIDIIVLSELWLTGKNIVSLYELKDYNFYHFTSNYNKASGVGIYVHNNYQCNNISLNNNFVDISSVQITHKQSNKHFSVSAIYCSPNVDYDITYNCIKDLLDKCLNPSQDNIIIGDINVNFLELQGNTYKNLDILLAQYGIQRHINSITRPTDQSNNSDVSVPKDGTGIDWVTSNTLKHNFHTYILLEKITDHYPIIACLQNFFGTNFNEQYNANNIYIINYNRIRENLINHDWSNIYNLEDTNDAWNTFIDNLQKYIQNNTSVKTQKSYANFDKPWMTRGLYKSIRTRNRLYYKQKLNPNNISISKNYKAYRNLLKTLIAKAKNNYYKRKLNDINGNQNKSWKLINEIIGRKRINVEPNNLWFNINDSRSSTKLANIFKEHLSNLYSNNSEQTTHIYNRDFDNIANIDFTFDNVSLQQVANIINNMNNKTTPGVDNIPVRVIKENIDKLGIVITYLVNKSIQTGIFPNIAKTSKVKLFYKNKDKNNCNNYRAIHIMSVVGKILEQVMRDKLYNHFEHNNYWDRSQYGFRRNLSTEDAISTATEYIRNNINKGRYTAGCAIDFTKAFDLVNHNILLKKLQDYGIRGKNLSLLKSYLLNRNFVVYIDGNQSGNGHINAGVPQGSCLAPFLFSLYMNDLPQRSENMNNDGDHIMLIYADDILLLYSHKNIQYCINGLQNLVYIVENWCNENMMIINPDKCNLIIFGSKRFKEFEDIYKYTIKINNVNIKASSNIKYLGIFLDCTLSWNKHIEYLCHKLTVIIIMFYKLRQYLNENILNMYYSAYVNGNLNYCISIWAACCKSNLSGLEAITNKIVKIICRKDLRVSPSEAYKQLNQLNPLKLYMYRVMIKLYNHLKDKKHIANLNVTLTNVQDIYNIRRIHGRNKLVVPNYKNNRKKFSREVHFPIVWNYVITNIFLEITDVLSNDVCLSLFKREVLKYLITLSDIELKANW